MTLSRKRPRLGGKDATGRAVRGPAVAVTSPLQRIAGRLGELPPAVGARLIAAGDALAAGDFAHAEAEVRAVLVAGGVLALRLLGLIHEQANDYPGAFSAYAVAHKRAPNDPDGVRDLARLARRMNQPALAADLLLRLRLARPDDLDDARDLIVALRDLDRLADAMAVARDALGAHPQDAHLWSLMGSIAHQGGDDDEALIFHAEAQRLAPRDVPVLANTAIARIDVGQYAEGERICDIALAQAPPPRQANSVRMTRALARLAQGKLKGGWDDYAARLSPDRPDATLFEIPLPRWTPDQPLNGLRLLLVGEQGLGDEVLFGSLLPDAIAALGDTGALSLALEPRLIPSFARSFPGVTVTAHASQSLSGRLKRSVPDLDPSLFDAWAPLGALLPRLRPTIERFAPACAFLRPAPDQVARWRVWLAALPPGPKVGVLWKSRLSAGLRSRRYAPFAAWEPMLRRDDLVFVNLQYGDSADDIAQAATHWGARVEQPPGLDLMNDLDGLIALCAALDLVIGPPTATTNLAAAAGAETWIMTGQPAWTPLGLDIYPWYARAKALLPKADEDWPDRIHALMGDLDSWRAVGRDRSPISNGINPSPVNDTL